MEAGLGLWEEACPLRKQACLIWKQVWCFGSRLVLWKQARVMEARVVLWEHAHAVEAGVVLRKLACLMEAGMGYGSRFGPMGGGMSSTEAGMFYGSRVVAVEASTLYGIVGLCVPP